MKHIERSPVNHTLLKPYLNCKDHTVSRETFSIYIDEKSELLVTTPRPYKADLAKYYDSKDYISHTERGNTIINKLYLFVRNYTIRRKVKLLESFNSTEKTLLDIGAGTGDFLKEANNSGWSISGIEPNINANKIAQRKTGIEIKTDIASIENCKFDVITMWHVLEHIDNLNEYISILKKLLKTNGTLVVAVPNFKSFDANYYKEYWAAYDVPRHLWHFSKKSIEVLFKNEGMNLVRTIPMKFDSFYVSLLSEKYKTGRSNLLKAFYLGIKSNYKAISTKEYSSHIYIIKNQ